MTSTKLSGGRFVHRAGDWSGELVFTSPILLVDCLDCVTAFVKERAKRHIDSERDLLESARRAVELLEALRNIRPALDLGGE